VNSCYGWAKAHGCQEHLDLDHTSDVARQLQICTAVIALASTLISTLPSIKDAELVWHERADWSWMCHSSALLLQYCFFFYSVTSEALRRRLLYSLDSFTLSNNLPGLLSSIANVGCRG